MVIQVVCLFKEKSFLELCMHEEV